MNEVAPSDLSLTPVNGCVLVKLDRTDKKEGKYDTRTHGTLLAIATTTGGTLVNSLIGKRVYFEEYKEGARIKKNGELYCFIKFEDIRGFENVEAN